MAILRNKNITFSLILMCLIVVSPIANAQLGGLGGLGGLLGGLLGSITSIFNIQGLLRCSVTGTVSTNNVTSVPPPFPSKFSVLILFLSIKAGFDVDYVTLIYHTHTQQFFLLFIIHELNNIHE